MQFFTRVLAFAAAAAPFLGLAAPVSTAVAGQVIPGKWIITLKPDADIAAVAAHKLKVREIHARNIARRDVSERESGGIEREYGFGEFKGYSGSFDAATVDELKNMPEVLNVEADTIMTTFELVTQSSSPWGLASVSSRTNGATNYIYDSTDGEGMFNYAVDTGVRLTHKEFEGRAVWGYNAVNSNNTDNAGHGTHVAGIMAGKTYGVAKKATIVAVKIFEGNSGSASVVISGFNWAVNDIVAKNRTTTAVINMSLGGTASTTWDTAITAAWKQGVLAVVAAGNENRDATLVSPARSPEVLCVGNIQSDDMRRQGSTGSNWGTAVAIFAPGTGIVSSYYSSDTATQSLTGTSMASPHVAGLVSYIRGLEGAMSADKVKARVLALATPGRVQDAKGSANLLAYNGTQIDGKWSPTFDATPVLKWIRRFCARLRRRLRPWATQSLRPGKEQLYTIVSAAVALDLKMKRQRADYRFVTFTGGKPNQFFGYGFYDSEMEDIDDDEDAKSRRVELSLAPALERCGNANGHVFDQNFILVKADVTCRRLDRKKNSRSGKHGSKGGVRTMMNFWNRYA